MNRDDLKQYLVLIEREIEIGKLAVEKHCSEIGKEACGRDHTEALATLARLREAQRDLEANRDELLKSINS